jgi:tetratricopeptide (TPR) repeat protein
LFKKVLTIETKKKNIYWAGAHYHLGEIHKELNRFEDARVAFKECLKLNPHHKSCKQKLKEIGDESIIVNR